MNRSFTLSVVIPAYNESTRIDRSVQSVLAQTRPVDEVIVVDDGSTDGTADVLAKYGGRVTCIRQDNQGQGVARNTGIRQARGEWIAFLDADDEWLPQHIENAFNILSRYPEIVWLIAAFELRSEDGKMLPNPAMDDPILREGVLENYFYAQARTSFSCSSSILIKKQVFDQVGLFNAEIKGRGEDLDLWFRIALRYPKIGFVRTPGCIYWRRAGSSTTSSNWTDIPRFLRRIEITSSSSQSFNGDVRRWSDFLVQSWVIQAIKSAIKQNDPVALRTIQRKFDKFLSLPWRVILRLFQNSLIMKAAQTALPSKTFGQH